ncbi:MAG: exodeoxyribonuclease VII large subunit [Methyloligellaceae bacterium]
MENPESQAPLGGNIAEFTVSELSFVLKRFVEENFAYVRVRGELGRISRPASGHVYVDLKDDKAVLSGVIWRGVAARLKVQPEEGMEVVATGKLTTYPGQSRYQIVIESLEPAGVGALLAQLEKLKKRLAAEGLFDEARKKPLPFLPRVVGIVTSPSGAVIRDMLHGFAERFPVHVVVWPVRVQGETCGAEVAAAIRGFNALGEEGPVPRPDLLIVARGGGSVEDLWGFNEEQVVRAAAASRIPLISAVGHETDWTLIDLAADARAPTPTKAAEWAVPKQSDLLARLLEVARRLDIAMRRTLERHRAALTAASRGLPRPGDLLALPRQRLDTAAARLPGALLASARRHGLRLAHVSGRLRPGLLAQRTALARERLARLEQRARRAFILSVQRRRAALDAQGKLMASLGHRGVLARGFALVRDSAGRMIRSAAALKPGDAFDVEFADGRVPARAEGGSRQSGRQKGSGGGQGTLF